jgi:membrane-bound serine protease (ClpP class)
MTSRPMRTALLSCLALSLGATLAQAQALAKPDAGKPKVYVIPVQDEVADPTLFIVRRGLKEAIERGAHTIVLDMDTPGGSAGSMLEIMEALDKFPGRTLTYVNAEAGSAGAIIAAVTDEIYFAPTGVMGAAEVIFGTGQDLGDGLKRKMTSYINAKIRALSDSDPRRSDVLKAMTTPDFEFKIGDKVIKEKGELLTLTAKEAVAKHGEPPTALLAAGTAASLAELLDGKFGAGQYELVSLHVTWSEELAKYITRFASVFMGLGMLLLFIEFKTPGFGWMGVSGIILLLLVFFGSYAAGLSGHEPMLLFVIGLALVLAELIFFPGVVAVALTGVAMMLGSLIWAGADLWPNEPVTISMSGEVFMGPALDLALALLISGVLFSVLLKYLPKTALYQHLIVQGATTTPAQVAGLPPEMAASLQTLIGQQGVAITALFPSGVVEISGRRLQARVDVGTVAAGETIRVIGCSDFSLKVQKLKGS